MKQVDEQVLQAFEALRTNPYQIRILEWVKESLAESREAADVLEDVKLYRAQGANMQLSEILKTATEAGQTLQAIRAGRAKPKPTL